MEVNKTRNMYLPNYNVIDFNADDRGIWIIYAAKDTNHTMISRINETTLEPLVTANISLEHQKVGEMFIVCGVLYAVDSVNKTDTQIRFALDLYSGKMLEDKSIAFKNPLNGTMYVGYNHNTKEIITWNYGHQLSYPVKINARGVTEPPEESLENKIKNSMQGHSKTNIYKIPNELTAVPSSTTIKPKK